MNINENGYFEGWKKVLADGRIVEVVALTYGRARIVLGDGRLYDNGW